MKDLLPQISEMLASGIMQKEVEAALGLSGYRPVHALQSGKGRNKRIDHKSNAVILLLQPSAHPVGIRLTPLELRRQSVA